MSNEDKVMEQLVDAAEKIGVVGSPSSTGELALDILGSAVSKKLVGELAIFHYLQDTQQHYALGQITEVTLRNIWHEDPTMRSLIRQRGRVDAVSERQDTHQGEMTISAVFSGGGAHYRPSILGTVPATGTPIHLVKDKMLDELLSPYREQIFYLGHVYGSEPKLPLWFKHFNSGPGGAGEAYHLGIFGKTGCGKSVLAKMILLAYARHPKMGLFVLDPQGEFALGLTEDASKISMGTILCHPILQGLGRPVEVYNLSRLRLDRWEIFGELLVEFGFFEALGFKHRNYQENMADYLIDFLRDKKEYTMKQATSEDMYTSSLNFIRDNVHRIYATQPGQDRVQGFVAEALEKGAIPRSPFWDRWSSVAQLFAEARETERAHHVVRKAIESVRTGARPLIVVDLSQKPANIMPGVWDEKIKPLLIDRFLDAIIREAERAYQEGKSLNTLMVIDEAHRLAPRGRLDNERRERIKRDLVNAVRTTRKYGLGWMFLSQTLSSLDDEIIKQLRISFFGFGLGMGSEFRALRELVGGRGKALDLYQRFRDPHSSFDVASREYSFMTIGPVSPLSFAGTPLFFNAFNKPERFLTANGLASQLRLGL
jgi:DNA helicase HerA-like ATPase